MRILKWNANGPRAARRKGYEIQLERLDADAGMLPEIRVHPDQLPDEWNPTRGWHVHRHPAEQKGCSGTTTPARTPLMTVGTGIDGEGDPKGRVLITRPWSSASGGPEAHGRRDRAVQAVGRDPETKTETSAARRRFQHRPPRARPLPLEVESRTSGFLPRERTWMKELVDSGWSDVVREEAGDVEGPYTWCSNPGSRSQKRGGDASGRSRTFNRRFRRPRTATLSRS